MLRVLVSENMSADSLQDNLLFEETFPHESLTLDDASLALDDAPVLDQVLDQDVKQEKQEKQEKEKQEKEKQIKELLLEKENLKYIGKINDYKRLNPKENTLIIAASALKCTSILVELKYLKRKIGKLFSRHLKLSDQLLMLEHPSKINVGTPNRILKLINSLSIKKVVIDLSSDKKGFSILDLKDTRRDLLDLLDNLDRARVFIKI